MKKLTYPLIALIILAGCKKGKQVTPAANGKIFLNESAVTNTGSSARIPLFTSQDSITVFGLMSNNSLSTNGFVFYAYQSYTALDQNSLPALYQIATAKQVRNGLPVFFEDITFGFHNGTLNGPPPAQQFIAGSITLDNTPNQSLQALRNIFIKTDSVREATNIGIRDSTLVAQLGYYNTNLNGTIEGGAASYIKVWYVHPQHWPWPLGYFRDDNGTVVSFDPLTHSGPVNP